VAKTAELEELLNKLNRDTEELPRIKADVLNILKITNTFINKDNLNDLIQ